MSSLRLISNYDAVQLRELRQAGLRPHPHEPKLSTYRLEYYVEYVTMCSELRYHKGLRHDWNCIRDGFPLAGNLRAWCRKHEALANARNVELLVVSAVLRRCSNGEVLAEVEL